MRKPSEFTVDSPLVLIAIYLSALIVGAPSSAIGQNAGEIAKSGATSGFPIGPSLPTAEWPGGTRVSLDESSRRNNWPNQALTPADDREIETTNWLAELSPNARSYPQQEIGGGYREGGIVSLPPVTAQEVGGIAGVNYIDVANPDVWYWQVVPEGLIYRSYQAGPREPKISTVIHQEDGTTFWDPIVGGRVGLIRFGNGDAQHPQGWQLDAEGAAMLRLNVDENVDVDATDYRFGFPITYGVGKWQFKFGYYHLSSHLGDEFSIRNPGVARINYVRDAGFFGVSYFPEPWVRVYGEVASAFLFRDGGAEPWEFQFGTEMSRPGITGNRGTPFLAINVHLLEELDFGGAVTVQTGWLWRNRSGRTFRMGLHYHNGHSSQYQFLANSESQIGAGVWYDF